MDREKTFIIAVTGFLALLVVFIYLIPFAGNFVANTRFEGYARSVGIRIIKESPPLPSVTSGRTQIPVIQSSYCWAI
ncbi:sorbitol-specific phosphotransferase system component IIC [Paenibacillus sp. V4I9]|nr:sorbitol-specific phosphotransferase system component IIC [Paenibacillus sp. V4I9]